MARATYKGIAFPFAKSSTAFPAGATDDELIRQSVIQIVMTGKGERVMRPDFGSNAYAFVFENNDLVLKETIRADIMSAITRYEPRVIVRDVEVTREETETAAGNVVDVRVIYVVIATKQQQSVDIRLAA